MNKIFKKVFNASRGKMMVVSEATSSTQSGKKAAVTVAVIGAIASGAAFAETTVLTANTFAGEILTAGNHVVDFTKLDLKDVTSTKDQLYLVGGPSLKGNAQNSLVVGSAANETANKLSSGVSLTNADFSGTTFIVGAGLMEGNRKTSKPTPATNYKADATYFGSSVELTDVHAEKAYVIGGGKIYDAGRGTLEVTNTHVSLNGNTQVNCVIGGSFVSGDKAKTTVLKTESTNIFIGKGVKVNGQVVGGHYQNWYGENASVGTINIVIDGATVVGEVVGGNVLETNKRTDAAAMDVQSLVQKANITIKDSSVGSIYVGDYAINDAKALSSMSSDVKQTTLHVENSTINGDVVGGSSITGKNDVSVEEPGAVSITMMDTNVKGTITSDSVGVDPSPAKPDTNKTISLTNVSAEAVKASSGAVDLRAEGEGKTSIGKLEVDDSVTVKLSADGEANDAAGGDITEAIVIAEGEFSADISMEEGMYQGAASGSVKDGVANVQSSKNSIMSNTLDLATAAPLSINRLLMNDVRKRLGNIRSAEGTHGVWARYDGGRLSGAMGLENDFHTLQFGIDTVPAADAPRFGVAFSYTKSDTDMKRGGAEMDAFGLAAYATKMYDNGAFVDVIGRIATADTDIVVDGDKKGSMDNLAVSLSAEAGWRLNMTERHYVEPQVEVTYTRVNNSDLTLSNGSTYGFDNVDSVIGRVGFAAGFTCPNDMGDVYVRASVVREFMGDATVRGSRAVLSPDGSDTWYEYGIGANFNVNKNTYVYADIERTTGAALDEDWRANVGVRYSF